MKRERYPPDDPREWIIRAKSNLALASSDIAGVDLEDLCFDAQQCAEKAIKAVFVHRDEHFSLIHDLEALLRRLEGNGVKVPKYVWDADELSRFAVLTRYPRLAEPVTRREYRRAIRIATAVLRWAERQVAKGRTAPEGDK